MSICHMTLYHQTPCFLQLILFFHFSFFKCQFPCFCMSILKFIYLNILHVYIFYIWNLQIVSNFRIKTALLQRFLKDPPNDSIPSHDWMGEKLQLPLNIFYQSKEWCIATNTIISFPPTIRIVSFSLVLCMYDFSAGLIYI